MDNIIIFKVPNGIKAVYPIGHPKEGQEFWDVMPGGVMISVLERTFVEKMKAAGKSEDEILQELHLSVQHHKDKYEHRDAMKSALPDRYFRAAWTDDLPTDTVDIDMEKAKPLHMDKLRAMRQKKFEELGFKEKPNPEIEQLLSEGLRAQLKELRDIPQSFDLSGAQNPDELKALIPNSLK